MPRSEFARVGFGYVPERSVFENLNLNVTPGQFVALVGPTGSGKSTLIGLVARFYHPVSGEIKIDGQDRFVTIIRNEAQQVFNCVYISPDVRFSAPQR